MPTRLHRVAASAALFFCAALHAQTGTLPIAASNISDSSGAKLAHGTIYFAPVTNGGVAMSYRIGGGGQAVTRAVACQVTNGAITGSCRLADVSQTNPVNVCFSASVLDAQTGKNILGPGYSCIQPSPSAAWVSGGVGYFDQYIPAGVPGTAVTAGPTGATGATGTAAVVTSNGVNGGFAVPGTLSNGSGGPPVLPADPTQPTQAATKEYADSVINSGIWSRQGTIVYGDATHEYAAQEPSVLYENGVWRLWYTCGWDVESLCYRSSLDGLNYSAALVLIAYPNSVSHGFVMHDTAAGKYYFYAANSPTLATQIDRWTSSDGVNGWTKTEPGVLTEGAAGSWDDGPFGNVYVTHDSDMWRMVYEGSRNGVGFYISGVATSTDGVHWTKYSGNPTFYSPNGGAAGGPELHKIGSKWYVWGQGSATTNQNEPSDIYLWSSSDFFTWSLENGGQPVFARATYDEGVTNPGGQVADPVLVEVAGRTWMFYDAVQSQATPTSNNGAIHLKVAIAPYTLAQLVRSNEGSAAEMHANGNIDALHVQGGLEFNNNFPNSVPQPSPTGRLDFGTLSFLGNTYPQMCFNCYWDGANLRYTSSGPAAQFALDPSSAGNIQLNVAPPGAAGTTLPAFTNAYFATTDGLIGFNSGIRNTPGIQIVGTSGCTVAAGTIGTSCSVSVPLPYAEPDANYSVLGCIAEAAQGGVNVGNVNARTTTGFSVKETALTADASIGGTIACQVIRHN